jgi:hypothetical protein
MTKIRLACMVCNLEDFDGINAGGLRQAIRDGWKCVERVQSYRESCSTMEQPGYSVLDWWTHLGWCPDCAPDDL